MLPDENDSALRQSDPAAPSPDVPLQPPPIMPPFAPISGQTPEAQTPDPNADPNAAAAPPSDLNAQGFAPDPLTPPSGPDEPTSGETEPPAPGTFEWAEQQVAKGWNVRRRSRPGIIIAQTDFDAVDWEVEI